MMQEGLGFQPLPHTISMARPIRVLLLDLLVERAEFGHGGNQEVIRPLLEKSDVEVLLLTPQMQSVESGLKIELDVEVTLKLEDVPYWDDEYPFWENNIVELDSKKVNFRRIVMPMINDDIRMKKWVEDLSLIHI